MITPKIKALFQFVDFLHSNIESFNKYEGIVDELHLLSIEKDNLDRKKNYKDKLKYDVLQVEIEAKFKIIQENIFAPIRDKAIELNVCDFEKEPLYYWYDVEIDIDNLKENFSDQDLTEIINHKNKYIEYRTRTNGANYFGQNFLFRELDEVLKIIFDFFKETELNEFEAFETKTIQVDTLEEALQILTRKQNKDDRFWLTYFDEKYELEKDNYKSIQWQIDNNGCFILNNVKVYTPELVVIFISKDLPALNLENKEVSTINGWKYLQTYIDGYNEGEQFFENNYKVQPSTLYGTNAEQYVKDVHSNFFHVNHIGAHEGWYYVKNQFPIVITHKVIREFGYYSGIVNRVEEQVKKYPNLFATFDKCEDDEQKHSIIKQSETLSVLITHEKSAEIVESVKVQYKNIRGKQLKILLLAFQELRLLPKERIAQKFHNCCKKEFGWNIASYNAMNQYIFNEVTDSVEFMSMKQYLETLIKTN